MSRAIPPHWPQSVEIVQKIKHFRHEASGVQKVGSPSARKGLLFLNKQPRTQVKPAEQLRITARRMAKAERDERMDVTHSLTPVKQYMSGFTRPSDLRTSNWFPGGAYISRGKVYESPASEAYQPHTVFLLETRYNIRYGLGRVESPEYVYGVCPEAELPAILAQYNSRDCPGSFREVMDNARWPWGPQLQAHSRAKWWTDSEDLETTLKELGSLTPERLTEDFAQEEDEDEDEGEMVQVKPREPTLPKTKPPKTTTGSARVTDIDILYGSNNHSLPASVRAFHSSSTLSVGHSYNDDHIVPDFYIQRKQAKANKEDEESTSDEEQQQLQDSPSLMDHLSDGILSDEIVASTRRLPSKIPTELFDADGVLVHPSGFVIPTPSEYISPERKQRERDLAQQTAAVAERVLEEDYTDVTAETSSRRGKVPFELRREDGTVSHPSGFEPPTAADDFEHSGNSTVDSHIGQQPTVLGSNPAGAKRGLHTTAIVRAEEVEWDFTTVQGQAPEKTFIQSDEYLPTLKDTPFWRPLMTVTVSTRPIALTILRLAKGLPMGRPFHTELGNDDRKCRISFAHRMRQLRLKRLENLAVDLTQTLAGCRGGIIGLRFDVDSLGRGIGGEGLENPLPFEKRTVGVGIADWYGLAPDVKELLRERGRDEIPSSDGREALQVFYLDSCGQRISSKTGEVIPWSTREETRVDRLKREPWFLQEYSCLRSALNAFKKHETNDPFAQSSTPKHTHRRVKATTSALDEGKAEDDDEVQLSAFDEDGTDGSLPTVLTRDKAHIMHGLSHWAFEESLGDPDAPPDFVIMRNGKPIFGPRDGNGEIVMDGMTCSLHPVTARQVVSRRLDMWLVRKRADLAEVMASRHSNVTYAKSVNPGIIQE
ncbi:hypothetical protein C8R43DRAFT_1063933 [Mycena crocata]|nr:hypothetical protein C8R43DRAFT_1063933 [Mycena crocata]